MKIERVECIPMVYHMEHPIYSGTGRCDARQLLLVRIYADNGMVGLGEAAPYGGPVQTTQEVIEREIAPMLIGEDPANTERIWHKCYYTHFQHARGGIFISALSGVDIALWDLKGKIAGMPLYKMLGGFRNQIPVYGSGGFYKEGEGIDELVKEAESYANQGLHGVKIKVARTCSPFSLRVFNHDINCKMVTLEEDIERVAAVKHALGKDCPLMLDANTNWKDLGGQDEAIVVIGREAGSGTRGAFEELLGIEDQCQYAQELNETGAVLAKVAKTSGSIGYVSLDVLDDTVSPLQLDGVEPSEKTVKDGSYALQRPFVMATNGKISEQSKQVQAVFDFINSDDGQKIIEKVGLVTPNK